LDEKPTVASGLPVHFGYIFLYWFILVNWANNNRSGLAYFIFASNIVNLNLLGLYHILELVGGFKHFLFSIIYGIILPVDKYFPRWLKPPTSEEINDSNDSNVVRFVSNFSPSQTRFALKKSRHFF
jgi:hypothetical protein